MTSEEHDKTRISEWRAVLNFVKFRTCNPYRKVIFCLFMILALPILGGVGVIVEILREFFGPAISAETSRSLFSMAIVSSSFSFIGTSSLHVILEKSEIKQKFLRLLGVAVLVLSIIFMIIWAGLHYDQSRNSLYAAILFALASFWFTGFAIGQSDIFDEHDPSNPGGGNLQRNLPGNMRGITS